VPAVPPSGDPIAVEHDGTIATIWLNRPEKRNAMSYAMWAALGEACQALGRDRSVRVVVVRGAGAHFCAGADITELHAERPASVPSFMQVNIDAEHALAQLPKPTVAFVEGDCIGGGCAIAIDCDLRLATTTARFGITPAKLGIVYPVSSLERVVRLLGPAAAKHLLYTGDLVDVDRALRVGLVDEVVETESAERRLRELCVHLAGRSLRTQAATKEMVAAVVAHGSVPSEVADRWAREVAASGDPSEGVAAFLERRPASFTWSGPAEA
jgi:enoyl-CoA hydratase/carnithine racemase